MHIWTGERAVNLPAAGPGTAWEHRTISRGGSLNMSAPVEGSTSDPAPVGRGLSVRILSIAVICLLLGEVLIYVPSIARFRESYLQTRIAAAHLATLAPSATGAEPLDLDLADSLLLHSGTLAITVGAPAPRLMLGEIPQIDATYHLDRNSAVELIFHAFETLWHGGARIVRVVAAAPMEAGATIEIVLDEAHLWMEMVAYSRRILVLSLVLSVIVASLLFWRLQRLIVAPLAELTRQLGEFRRHPEDSSIERPLDDRADEIGVVQLEMHAMRHDLRQALTHKARLAALGEAVGKINHDLRNILSSALLVSDRLERSDDPDVKTATPRLVKALERASRLCQATLDFARSRPRPLSFAPVELGELVEEVAAGLGLPREDIATEIEVAESCEIRVDRDEMHRVLTNLMRNAIQAMPEGGRLTIRAHTGAEIGGIVIEIIDTGVGIPEKTRDSLFEPFVTSGGNGGTGLGLAIVREIMHRHGGDVRLAGTGPEGTSFALHLPPRALLSGDK